MESNDLLRKSPSFRVGYIPQSISKTAITLNDLRIYRRLKTIPSKITAYFHREKIKEVYVSDCFSRLENYYIIRAMDDTLFHVDY